jgi:hypothetical protein
MSKTTDPAPGTTYSHAPRPAGMPVAFAIKGRKLVIDRMGQTIDVNLSEIEEMRVAFEPRSFAQSQLRTRLKLANGPLITLSSVSFRSIVFAERQDAQYGAFIRNLARAIAKANPKARFTAGRSLPFWLAMVTSGFVLMAAIVVFIAYALNQGEMTAVAIGVFVAAIGVWQMEPLIRLNRPQPFSPDDPPAALVPMPAPERAVA